MAAVARRPAAKPYEGQKQRAKDECWIAARANPIPAS